METYCYINWKSFVRKKGKFILSFVIFCRSFRIILSSANWKSIQLTQIVPQHILKCFSFPWREANRIFAEARLITYRVNIKKSTLKYWCFKSLITNPSSWKSGVKNITCSEYIKDAEVTTNKETSVATQVNWQLISTYSKELPQQPVRSRTWLKWIMVKLRSKQV